MNSKLPSKKIVLPNSGIKITVLKATRLMSLQRASLVTDASGNWEGRAFADLTLAEKMKRYDEITLLPALLACSEINLNNGKASSNKVLSIDDFESMADEDIQVWINAVKTVNTNWLPLEEIDNSVEKEEQEIEKNA